MIPDLFKAKYPLTLEVHPFKNEYNEYSNTVSISNAYGQILYTGIESDFALYLIKERVDAGNLFYEVFGDVE